MGGVEEGEAFDPALNLFFILANSDANPPPLSSSSSSTSCCEEEVGRVEDGGTTVGGGGGGGGGGYRMITCLSHDVYTYRPCTNWFG